MKSIHISIREVEVLELLSNGKTTKEIAHKLFISANTIRSHRKNLLKKLACKNAAQMVRIGFEYGLL